MQGGDERGVDVPVARRAPLVPRIRGASRRREVLLRDLRDLPKRKELRQTWRRKLKCW